MTALVLARVALVWVVCHAHPLFWAAVAEIVGWLPRSISGAFRAEVGEFNFIAKQEERP